MGFCHNGIKAKVLDVSMNVRISSQDPLIQLANLIAWQDLIEIALSDLKKTEYGFWWMGRRMNLRTHLSVMILQTLLKTTDRGIEIQVSRSPIYQVFCGKSIVPNWRCPDHTKIEVFRNRLSPETQKSISDSILLLAVKAGFACPSSVDIDSTVQEANMSYPSDATLMLKLAKKCFKSVEFLRTLKKKYIPRHLNVDIKTIAKKAKQYFFLAKNSALEKRRSIFKDYYHLVKKQLSPAIDIMESLCKKDRSKLPWNINHAINQISTHGRKYLKDVGHFVKNHRIKAGKILSFHAFAVSCIKKGKVGKDKEFGRVIQLGRLVGNFVMAYRCTSIQMPDKISLIPAILEHEKLFGKGVLKDVATDRGYYSKKNIQDIEALGISTLGVQRTRHAKNHVEKDSVVLLNNRRAGIEPIIGHIKEFGLRRSKMKSDSATLSQVHRSVSGFNLHQMIRCLAKAA